VSHRQHLIRCLLGLKLSLPASCEIVPVASPSRDREERFPDRIAEALKLLTYSVLLSPIWLRGLFRSGLRGHPFPDIKGGFTLSQPGLREGDFRTPDAATVLPPTGEAADGRTRD
jgi:hypothetical protein